MVTTLFMVTAQFFKYKICIFASRIYLHSMRKIPQIILKMLITTITVTICITLYAQKKTNLDYFAQYNIIVSDGGYAPFWLTANRQGLLSVNDNNGYARYGLEWSGTFDKKGKFGYSTVADIVVAYNQNADFYIQQLYADFSWKWVTLSIGSKERYNEMSEYAIASYTTPHENNKTNLLFNRHCFVQMNTLGSGGLSYSGNSRPIPQIRLEIPQYIPFPFTNKWVKIRGHIAYGIFTDGNFQSSFSRNNPTTQYGRNLLYHSKAGYVEIGKADKFPLIFEGGLEMYTQFGGDIYTHQTGKIISMPHDIMDFWKAFIPLSGSDDTPTVEQTNISGNQMGSWHAAFTIPTKVADIRLYGEHFFEDFSQLFFFEYQSDRNGNRNVIYYPWRDIKLGIRITDKSRHIPFISALQYEYLTTKDQSGALYHDPSDNFSEQMDGADNYYNHGIYPGWHHWGMGIGNPLIVSPAYNKNGSLQFRGNRITAHNIGINGSLGNILPLSYRLLYTYSENWGTYANPFASKKYTTSLLGEFMYAPAKSNWQGRISIAYDKSNLIEENFGIMITLSHVGTIFSK